MFRSIITFQKVYEYRSITKAAKELYVTQPSVSIQIKQLEKELGVTFFKRNGNKGLIPTENANRFYRDSQLLLNGWESSLNHLVKKRSNNRVRCTIGVSPMNAIYIIPHLIDSLENRNMLFDFEIVIQDSESILDSITKHELDFGLVERPFTSSDVEQLSFANDALVHAGDVNNPLWILGRPGSIQLEHTEKYFTENNIKPKKVLKVNDSNLISRLVTLGIGQSIVCKKSIENTIVPFQQLSQDYSIKYYLINAKIPNSKEIQNLIHLVRTLLPQLHF
ncbi:LysR family transcriptional regulator [Companilactobacillus furfuricola]|uniref:LysR family transcriptional regulator n=1 Tax=Companilactobacillus furfuricola TaxID=1462575 RepID=UPI000F77F2B2|nr:LysR family transcriptional regulator [Companilactobacillus furfuricola]